MIDGPRIYNNARLVHSQFGNAAETVVWLEFNDRDRRLFSDHPNAVVIMDETAMMRLRDTLNIWLGRMSNRNE